MSTDQATASPVTVTPVVKAPKKAPKPKASQTAEQAALVAKAKAAVKTPKGKKAPKIKKTPAKTKPIDLSALTTNQEKFLKTLKGTERGTKELTRKEIEDKMGVPHSFPSFKYVRGFEAVGVVGSSVMEGKRGATHYLTAKGHKAIGK